MRNNIKLKCIALPKKGNFNINIVYDAVEGWYDADAGETEMRVYDNNGNRYCFRDFDWLTYFVEI